MISNVNLKTKANEDIDTPFFPSTPPPKVKNSNPLTPKPSGSKISRPSSRKSDREKHSRAKEKKNKSIHGHNLSFLTPCKSRLDYDSIPVSIVDLKSCQADILRFKAQEKQNSLIEKKMMTEEWVKAKQKVQKEIDQDIQKHEETMTIQKIELKKMIKEKEKSQKINEEKDKRNDFLAVIEAKKKLNEQEKLKELEYRKIEKEKSQKRQKELEEKKNLKLQERKEKRANFSEFLEVTKRAEKLEAIRVKKEKEFDHAQELLGMRELTYQNSMCQKVSLEKVGALFGN